MQFGRNSVLETEEALKRLEGKGKRRLNVSQKQNTEVTETKLKFHNTSFCCNDSKIIDPRERSSIVPEKQISPSLFSRVSTFERQRTDEGNFRPLQVDEAAGNGNQGRSELCFDSKTQGGLENTEAKVSTRRSRASFGNESFRLFEVPTFKLFI